MRPARVAPIGLTRLPWLVALVAGWAVPATHADERDDAATVTAPSEAASFAKLLGLGDGIAIGESNETSSSTPRSPSC